MQRICQNSNVFWFIPYRVVSQRGQWAPSLTIQYKYTDTTYIHTCRYDIYKDLCTRLVDNIGSSRRHLVTSRVANQLHSSHKRTEVSLPLRSYKMAPPVPRSNPIAIQNVPVTLPERVGSATGRFFPRGTTG